MVQWEYKEFCWIDPTTPWPFSGLSNPLRWEAWLNSMGEKGWELVQFKCDDKDGRTCTFKRQTKQTEFDRQVKELADMILKAQEAMKIQEGC